MICAIIADSSPADNTGSKNRIREGDHDFKRKEENPAYRVLLLRQSLATILLALEHGEPLDEAVYCEVMFDKRTSGEVPEHRAFIYETAIPRLERLGIPVRVLRSDKTYLDLFAGTVTRGPKKGLRRGFPLCGHCYVQRDCKLRPIRLYNRTLTPDTVQYVGIASDEPVRLRRL